MKSATLFFLIGILTALLYQIVMPPHIKQNVRCNIVVVNESSDELAVYFGGDSGGATADPYTSVVLKNYWAYRKFTAYISTHGTELYTIDHEDLSYLKVNDTYVLALPPLPHFFLKYTPNPK